MQYRLNSLPLRATRTDYHSQEEGLPQDDITSTCGNVNMQSKKGSSLFKDPAEDPSKQFICLFVM